MIMVELNKLLIFLLNNLLLKFLGGWKLCMKFENWVDIFWEV